MNNPRLLTVTLTTQNTNYQLSALLAAIDTGFAQAGGVYTRCSRLSIQADNAGGAAKYFIGNSDISATNFGRGMIATQIENYGGLPTSVIDLTEIWLRSDTNTALLNITVEFA